MEIKTGARNYSTEAQQLGLKGDGSHRMSATDRERAFGNEDVGDVLNRIADPNWVDPKKKIRTSGGAELNKDAFLKLMLTQMKNQDPTNPMDSHDMAAQLAQFTSLEQLVNINDNLKEIKESQKPAAQFQALSLIGKTVSGDSSKVIHTEGTKGHLFEFELGADVVKSTITVKDGDGNAVRTIETGAMKKGKNQITWNVMSDDGLEVRPGEYQFLVDARDSSGSRVVSKTDFAGRISGVNFTPTGPVLLVGKQSVKLGDIKKIVDSEVESREAKGAGEVVQEVDPIKSVATPPVKDSAAVSKARSSNLDQIGMDSAMKNRLAKETGVGH